MTFVNPSTTGAGVKSCTPPLFVNKLNACEFDERLLAIPRGSSLGCPERYGIHVGLFHAWIWLEDQGYPHCLRSHIITIIEFELGVTYCHNFNTETHVLRSPKSVGPASTSSRVDIARCGKLRLYVKWSGKVKISALKWRSWTIRTATLMLSWSTNSTELVPALFKVDFDRCWKNEAL